MNRRLVSFVCSLFLAGQLTPAVLGASQPDLNFKIYSPPDAQPAGDAGSAAAGADQGSAATAGAPAAGEAQVPKTDDSAAAKTPEKPSSDSLWSTDSNASSMDPASGTTAPTTNTETAPATKVETPATDTSAADAKPADADSDAAPTSGKSDKVLKGYIRVVPSGTKIPIIMDTAVDSDTSQEGDEFAARTSEDLNIDGQTVVPAGSVIKGRIAQLNAPRNMGRSGSVALKFDTVTTPDNRQIPLVANLVAHGGVVHARRGLKDIALDTTTFALPTALGLGIGVLAGSSSKSSSSSSSSSKKIGKGTGALIGAGVGAAVGIAILCIKKGKKVDVRPGDELKIELAEDLRMPM